MNPKIILVTVLLVVGMLFITRLPGAITEKGLGNSIFTVIKDPTAEENFRTSMRKLWEDHITWTRNVIFCIIDDLPGTNQAVTRLLENQDDIGNAIKPYYGVNAAEELTDLLYVHINIAADLLKAAKADDGKAFDEANKRWSANANAISLFLSKVNPNWELKDVKRMMDDHLKLTTDEAIARKKKDYEEDVRVYGKVHEEILQMSDMLSNGIVAQFPEKFQEAIPIGMEK